MLTGSWTRAARPGATRCVFLKLRESIGSRFAFALISVPLSSQARVPIPAISVTLFRSPFPFNYFPDTPYALKCLFTTAPRRRWI